MLAEHFRFLCTLALLSLLQVNIVEIPYLPDSVASFHLISIVLLGMTNVFTIIAPNLILYSSLVPSSWCY